MEKVVDSFAFCEFASASTQETISGVNEQFPKPSDYDFCNPWPFTNGENEKEFYTNSEGKTFYYDNHQETDVEKLPVHHNEKSEASATQHSNSTELLLQHQYIDNNITSPAQREFGNVSILLQALTKTLRAPVPPPALAPALAPVSEPASSEHQTQKKTESPSNDTNLTQGRKQRKLLSGSKPAINKEPSTSKSHSVHKCLLCSKVLSNKRTLAEHILLHDKIKPHKCQICGKEFTHASRFSTHKRLHRRSTTM